MPDDVKLAIACRISQGWPRYADRRSKWSNSSWAAEQGVSFA
jgi:hypothetical protein